MSKISAKIFHFFLCRSQKKILLTRGDYRGVKIFKGKRITEYKLNGRKKGFEGKETCHIRGTALFFSSDVTNVEYEEIVKENSKPYITPGDRGNE